MTTLYNPFEEQSLEQKRKRLMAEINIGLHYVGKLKKDLLVIEKQIELERAQKSPLYKTLTKDVK